MPAPRCCIRRSPRTGISGYESRLSKKRSTQWPPDTRKHTVLPVSIRLKSTEKTPACVSMRAFLQPISARIYFGKTASHRKRARFVQSRGASPQAYWMSVKAAQRWGCAKRTFYGVCFLMPGGLKSTCFLRDAAPYKQFAVPIRRAGCPHPAAQNAKAPAMNGVLRAGRPTRCKDMPLQGGGAQVGQSRPPLQRDVGDAVPYK